MIDKDNRRHSAKNYVVIIGMIGIFMITGCANNPSGDTVVNKNEGVLEQAILEEAQENQNLDIPDTYQDSFQSSSDQTSIQVNAKVVKQDTVLPVLRVSPHEISAEDMQRWSEVLFEGNTAYDGRDVQTKSDIEQSILEFREYINDGSLREEAGSESEYQEYLDYYEDMIADLEEQYKSAPETYEPTETDWKFHPWGYYSDSDDKLEKTLVCIAQTKLNGYTAQLRAFNRTESDYLMHNMYFLYEEERNMDSIPYSDISLDDAKVQAEEVIGQIQSGEWALARSYDYSTEDESLYQLEYVPQYNGIPMVEAGYINLKSDDLYAANVYYADLEVVIMNGIVQSVEVVSPVDVQEVVNENVKTLSFDEIYASFKNYAQASFSQETLESMGISGGMTIDCIEQKLFRIKEKNSDDSFLIVPVWVFSQSVPEGSGNLIKNNCVIVNAVDGSIIDETLGY